MQSLSLCTKARENYQGITLLSTAGKILAHILLNRLIPMIAQENTPESQCGFRSNRGTVGMTFVLRQIQEKCRGQNVGLYTVLVDLTKAFDTVSLDGLWKIVVCLGCPSKIHHPLPAPWRSARSGEAQWVSVRQLPHLQQC